MPTSGSRFVVAASLALSSACWSTPVLAHHSFAMFDMTKRQAITGTVRALEWSNPHIWLWVDVKGRNGQTVSYGFEGAAPLEIARLSNWTKHAVAKGETVTVEFAPLKNGQPGGALGRVTKADGKVIGNAPGRAVPPGAAPAGAVSPGATPPGTSAASLAPAASAAPH